MEYRLKRYQVGLGLLSQMLRFKGPARDYDAIIRSDAPDDLEIVSAHYNPGQPDVITFIATSKEFPEVLPGEPIPLGEIWFREEELQG